MERGTSIKKPPKIDHLRVLGGGREGCRCPSYLIIIRNFFFRGITFKANLDELKEYRKLH